MEIIDKNEKECRVVHKPLNVETFKQVLADQKTKVLFIYCHGNKPRKGNSVTEYYLSI